MIAFNLAADLARRGVLLTIAETPKDGRLPSLRLRVRSPEPLPETLALSINDHRAELLQFIFELEETAAILEHSQGNTAEEARQLALSCVRGGTATGDGDGWLREYAERELRRLNVTQCLEPSEAWEVRRTA